MSRRQATACSGRGKLSGKEGGVTDATMQLGDVPFEELEKDSHRYGVRFVAVCQRLAEQFGYLLGKGVSMRVTCDTNREFKHKQDGSELKRGVRHLFATFRWKNKNFLKLYFPYIYTEQDPNSTVYILKKSAITCKRHVNLGFHLNKDRHSSPLCNLESADVRGCIKKAIRSAVPFVAENTIPALVVELMKEKASFLPRSARHAATETMKEEILRRHKETSWA